MRLRVPNAYRWPRVCLCVCVSVVLWRSDSEIRSRFICEHLLLLSCEIQTSSWSTGTVLRDVKKEGGREEIFEIEHIQKQYHRRELLVCEILDCLSNIFSSLLCKVDKSKFEKTRDKVMCSVRTWFSGLPKFTETEFKWIKERHGYLRRKTLRLDILYRVMQIKEEHLTESYGEVCTQGRERFDRQCAQLRTRKTDCTLYTHTKKIEHMEVLREQARRRQRGVKEVSGDLLSPMLLLWWWCIVPLVPSSH